MIENENHWILPIEGRVVDEIRFRAYVLEIHFTGEPDSLLTLRIESPFSFRDADGVVSLLNPQGSIPALAPVLAAHGCTVERALAYKNGGLEMGFAGGGLLTVEPDIYEAWQVSSSNGLLVVSLAGGNSLAIWSGSGEAP